ncbi:hypothetical protein MPLSOD_40543 [Mesorhizobium sp. SOD10]|nr:hypothetical protein MPLSOD_40543 [Mesorhizobium sp. SOD10]
MAACNKTTLSLVQRAPLSETNALVSRRMEKISGCAASIRASKVDPVCPHPQMNIETLGFGRSRTTPLFTVLISPREILTNPFLSGIAIGNAYMPSMTNR